jgi:carbon storage regulator CsrA
MEGGEPVLKVTVLEIRGARVRLGFDVDRDVSVHRSEVWERIRTRQPAAPTAP